MHQIIVTVEDAEQAQQVNTVVANATEDDRVNFSFNTQVVSTPKHQVVFTVATVEQAERINTVLSDASEEADLDFVFNTEILAAV